MTTCTFPGCVRKHRARGWCSVHYRRWSRHGDPAIVKPPGFPPQDRALCKFPRCPNTSKRGARGWCGKHYTRWYRHGSPEVDGNKSRRVRPLIERIMDRVRVTSSCWEWLGPKLPAGYGYLGSRQKHVYVHRAVYEHHHGPLTTDLQIHHLCRNKSCCNPDHLVALTRSQHVAAHREDRAKCLSPS